MWFNNLINAIGWVGFIVICVCVGLPLLYVILKYTWFFLYGLFTWQERVPIYIWRGTSFLMDWISFSCPDHYEWRKRKPFFEWLKCKIHRQQSFVDDEKDGRFID